MSDTKPTPYQQGFEDRRYGARYRNRYKKQADREAYAQGWADAEKSFDY